METPPTLPANNSSPTTNQTNPNQLTPNSSKNSAIKIVLIVLGVVLLALTTFLVWKSINDSNDALQDADEVNNQSPTTSGGPEADQATIKTYTNNEVGFSFQYPADWQVKENGKLCGNCISNTTFESPDLSGFKEDDFTNSEGYRLVLGVSRVDEGNHGCEGSSSESFKCITVDGASSAYSNEENCEDCEGRFGPIIYGTFVNDEYLYFYQLFSNNSEFGSQSDKILTQILTSFKFH